MASLINELMPEEGAPTTQSVRDNFLAAKTEIEELQNHIEITWMLFTAHNVSQTWTNMPSAETIVPTWYCTTKLVDLTSYTQVRFFCAKGTVAGALGSRLRLGFNPVLENVPANYLDPTMEGSMIGVDVVSQQLDTGWLTIDPAYKMEGYLAAIGELGDGVLDPIFFGIWAMFK